MIMIGGKWIIMLFVLCSCSIFVPFSFAFVKDRGSRDILDNNALPIAAPPTVLPPIDFNTINALKSSQNASSETTTTTIATLPVIDSINSPAGASFPTLNQLPPLEGIFPPGQIDVANTPALLTVESLPTAIKNSLNNPAISIESVELLPIRAFPLSEQTTIATPALAEINSFNNLTNQTNPGILLPTALPPIKGIFIAEQTATSNYSLDSTTSTISISPDIKAQSLLSNTNQSTSPPSITSSITLLQPNSSTPLLSAIISSTSAPTSTAPTTSMAPTTSTMHINLKGIPVNFWIQYPPIICPCGCFIKRLRNVIQETRNKKDKTQCFRTGVYANVENHVIDCPCGCVITTDKNTTVSIYPSRRKCLGKAFTASVDKQRIKCHCGCSGKTKEHTNYIIYPDDNCDCDKERYAEDCKLRKLFRMLDIIPEE